MARVDLPVSLGLLALDHVGVAVPDLNAAITFHTETLGLVLLHRETNARQGVEEAMLGPAGAEASGTRVQLLVPLSDTSPIQRFLRRSGPGLHHLAYRVDDIESTVERLREQGLRLLYDSAERGTHDSRINFIHPYDAGGVLIELVEPTVEN